jgi:lipopolysaccharide transport system ATP-binding protein
VSDVIIRAENVGKRYYLNHQTAGGYRRFSDIVMDAAKAPFRMLRGRAGQQTQPGDEEFWALKDVNFEVKQGEVVGIIGRNGAGKSTLLKILSRITEPTTGRIGLKGRVASLLEVGTGFHPELTGRENIFLNGAILGMGRDEIRAKFDEIVAFAEIERFLDTPVKRYSSGMYVRLAFAVAAHLEPEILIVDEVLAVGDAAFQRKCLAKMETVGTAGRTVLFVSHNIPAVQRLCPRVIMMSAGAVIADGVAADVTRLYVSGDTGSPAEQRWDGAMRPGDDVVRLNSVRVLDQGGAVSAVHDIRRAVTLEMDFEVLSPEHVLTPNFHFTNDEGTTVFVTNDLDPAWQHRPRPVGRQVSRVVIPGNFLAEGSLFVGAAISMLSPVTVHLFVRDALSFSVQDEVSSGSARGDYAGPYPGVVRPLLPWTSQVI